MLTAHMDSLASSLRMGILSSPPSIKIDALTLEEQWEVLRWFAHGEWKVDTISILAATGRTYHFLLVRDGVTLNVGAIHVPAKGKGRRNLGSLLGEMLRERMDYERRFKKSDKLDRENWTLLAVALKLAPFDHPVLVDNAWIKSLDIPE